MKILFATLDSYELNEKKCKCFEAKDEEQLFKLIEKKRPEVMVIEKSFIQKINWQECILTLRTRYPEVRIMVILDDKDTSDRRFLYHWMIFDIFTKENVSITLLKYRLYFPKTFQDIKGLLVTQSDEERKIYKKTIERYAFLERNQEFLAKEDNSGSLTYIFLQEQIKETLFLEMKIPYGKEAWKCEVEIKQNKKFQLSKQLHEDIQKVKELFNELQRIRRVVNQ